MTQRWKRLRCKLAIHQRLCPEGQFKLAFELSMMTRHLAERGIRDGNPTFRDRGVRQKLIRIWYGILVEIPETVVIY